MLQAGKLDSELLRELVFKHLTLKRPEVLLRSELGEDCAVLNPGGQLCVLSTDPITGAGEILGSLAVHVNCNDIAAQGIAPVGLMLTLLAPVGTNSGELEAIMKQAAREAALLDVEIIGGHTEITTAVNRMVVSGVAIGFKPISERELRRVQPGDVLVMTKMAGLEGTGILISDCAERLEGVLSPEELVESTFFLSQLSVVKEGVIGGRNHALKLHDVTEGGIYGAVWEMCQAAGVGCRVYQDRIPVHGITRKVCAHFKLDPYRLISSGSMLVILSPEDAETYITALRAEGIDGTIIGEITEAGLDVINGQVRETLLPPGPDELFRVVG